MSVNVISNNKEKHAYSFIRTLTVWVRSSFSICQIFVEEFPVNLYKFGFWH